jgi:hypothetical protein
MEKTTKLGGFPPIFLITPEFKKEIETSKNREFSSLPKSVSIKDILNIKTKEKKNSDKFIFDID